ncbi:MAG: hypothetical protein H7A36_05985 [Chlamydiales bacterium]|nr:hypothetical protein [Chlamydiales bacterium]
MVWFSKEIPGVQPPFPPVQLPFPPVQLPFPPVQPPSGSAASAAVLKNSGSSSQENLTFRRSASRTRMRYACKTCNITTFTSKKDFCDHLVDTHSESWNCGDCNKTLDRSNRTDCEYGNHVARHIVTKHPSRKVLQECGLCREGFTLLNQAKEHCLDVHATLTLRDEAILSYLKLENIPKRTKSQEIDDLARRYLSMIPNTVLLQPNIVRKDQ